MRMLRWMYGVTRKYKIRNDEHLRGTTRVVQASKEITGGMSNWKGHETKRDEERTLRKVFRPNIPE